MKQPKEIVTDVEKLMQPYKKEYGSIFILFDKSAMPILGYTKNVTVSHALAILQIIEKD